MWGHAAPCRCGVCLTLQRICHHIGDFTREPGYLDFAAERLRALAGELCDFIDSRRRDTNPRAASRGSDLLTSGGARESGGDPGQQDPEPGHQGREGAAKEEQVESVKSGAREVKSEDSECAPAEERGVSQAKSEATSHPSTAPKKKAKGEEREPLPRRDSRKRTKEEPAQSEREDEEPGTPHSEQKKKRRRRTRSRSPRRRGRSHSEEKGERSHHHSNPGGRSSASKPEPRPSQRPESDPPAKLRPRSPSHPPPGRGRGQGWSAAPRRDYRQEEWKPQDWKNKGVKKTETQRYFKEFLAQKRGL